MNSIEWDFVSSLTGNIVCDCLGHYVMFLPKGLDYDFF